MHYQPTTWPGARLPHAWDFDASGRKHSTLDLAGGGTFSLFTGLGGEPWATAAKELSNEFGIIINVHVIGPRQEYVDHTGSWALAREVTDSGCILTRPDQHVCWRSRTIADKPKDEIKRVLNQILAK